MSENKTTNTNINSTDWYSSGNKNVDLNQTSHSSQSLSYVSETGSQYPSRSFENSQSDPLSRKNQR